MTRLSATTLLALALSMGSALPLAAQSQRGAGGAAPPGTAGAPPSAGSTVSDATIAKTGTALRQISGIQRDFDQRAQGAAPEQRQGLETQANRAAEQAIAQQGLSVDEYTRVIHLAQADDGIRQRLLAAAGGGANSRIPAQEAPAPPSDAPFRPAEQRLEQIAGERMRPEA